VAQVPPAAPTALSATQVSVTRVDLTWVDNATNETGYVLERSADSAFSAPTAIALGANTTAYSDTGLREGVVWYRLKATRSTTSSAYATSVRGARIKDMTFEGGSLLGSSGASQVVGSGVALESAAPIKGSYSAHVSGSTAAYVQENFSPVDEVFVSFYFRLVAKPGVDEPIATIVHGTGAAAVNAGTLIVGANAKIQLRNGATAIGTGPSLKTGTVYRVALHQKKQANGKLLLEGYLATADQAFGAAFASTTSASLGTSSGGGSVLVGSTLSSGGLDTYLDDVKIDSAFMPSPSTR
jgi:hypothetical protein